MYNKYYVYFCQIKQVHSFLPTFCGARKDAGLSIDLVQNTLPSFWNCDVVSLLLHVPLIFPEVLRLCITRLYIIICVILLYIRYAAEHEKRTKILTNTPQLNFAQHNLINVFYSQVEKQTVNSPKIPRPTITPFSRSVVVFHFSLFILLFIFAAHD